MSRSWMNAAAAIAGRSRPHRHFAPPTGGRPTDPPPPPGGGQTITYAEDTVTDLNNPERGWYTENLRFGNTIGGVNYGGSPVEGLPNFDQAGLRMELFYINLRAYLNTNVIDQAFLDNLDNQFAQLRAAGKKCMLRFAYNNGDEETPEDTTLARMTTHWTTYLRPVVDANKDVIAVLQGGFAGPWGEQWDNGTSEIDTWAERDGLIAMLMQNTLPDMMVQWRAPEWTVNEGTPPPTIDQRFDGSKAARMGHYNDCIGSGYDMANTYPNQATWDWAYGVGPYTAMGGETCWASGLGAFNDASYLFPVLNDLGIDYLNATFWLDMLNKWNGESYDGENALAYLSKHLGYRLALLEATVPTTVTAGASMDVTLTFRNSGFGKVYNPRPLDLVFVGPGGPFTTRLSSDARRNLPLSGQEVTNTWTVTAPAGLQNGATYALHLRLPDPSPAIENDQRYAIRLANAGGMWDAATGRHNLGASVTEASSGGGGEPQPTSFSLLGDENFDRLTLDNTEQDQNGMTLRDWYDHLLASGTAGTYDADFNSIEQRPGNRQGGMYVGSLLMGLRLVGDLKLLDEAVRLAELWYGNMTTDGSGYLYLPGGNDVGLDTNLVAGLFARVMLAAHRNRALTSPAAHDYGAIADKYKTYLTDHFLPRELAREGTIGGPSGIVHDYVGWHHDGAGILYLLHAVTDMGGGGAWSLAEWEAERDWYAGYYFAASQEGVGSEGFEGRTTRVVRFTIYPSSTNPDSYSLMYTTYVRYMASYLTDLFLEGAYGTHLTETWLRQIAGSFADFVLDTTFTSNSLARTIGGDDPPNNERYGIPYNGTYRPRVSPADDRWQDSAYCYLEGFDSRGRIEDWGVQAWGMVGTYRNAEPNYAAARLLTKIRNGSWGVSAPASPLEGVGSTSTSLVDYPKTGPVTNGDWYVDPTAATNGVGTLANPFNSLHSAIAASSPDDLILIREGVLQPTSQYVSNVSGLRVFGYGDERPILDGSLLPTSGNSPVVFVLTGPNQHWKGLEVVNGKRRDVGYDDRSVGIENTSGCKVEDVRMHDCPGGSFRCYNASDNIIQDCIFYGNVPNVVAGADPTNVPDGFVTTAFGDRNTFVRDFAAHAGDDGFDLWSGTGHKIIDGVSYRCGYKAGTGNTESTGGDGGGYKLGGNQSESGYNLLQGSLAAYCRYVGLNANSAIGPLTFLNNTAAYCISYGALTWTNAGTVAKNNIAVGSVSKPDFDASGVRGTYNTWNTSGEAGGNGAFPITNAGFANVPAHDYSLGPSSPCRDAGEGGVHMGASDVSLELAKQWIPVANAWTPA